LEKNSVLNRFIRGLCLFWLAILHLLRLKLDLTSREALRRSCLMRAAAVVKNMNSVLTSI